MKLPCFTRMYESAAFVNDIKKKQLVFSSLLKTCI